MPTKSPITTKKKNRAAVALGKLGNSKGGKARISQLSQKERLAFARKGGQARAKKLTAEQLSEAGRKAVKARWKKRG